MKLLFVLILNLFVTELKAQQTDVAVSFAVGSSTHKKVSVNLDVAFQAKHITVASGYLVNISNISNIPHVFYLRGGKRIHTDSYDEDRSVIEIGGGAAYHSYALYYKDRRGFKPLVYMSYENYVIEDGSVIANAYWTSGQVFATVGLRYFFNRKYQQTCRF